MGKSLFKKFYAIGLFLLFFLSNFSLVLVAATDPDHSSSGQLTPEELIRGERLFYGLVYQKDRAINCAGCHNTRWVDSMNWNPDAYVISRKYQELTAVDLQKVLLNPTGIKLSEVHADIDLTEEDIVMIKGFMDIIAENGLKEKKPVINNLLLFIIFTILLLAALTDMVVTRKIRPRWINLLVFLVAGFFITETLVSEAIAIGRSEGYEPDQPIKFSHVIHAAENQTECIYCHHSAEYSKSAGIPGTNVCMNCHLIVRSGTRSGSWEINKIIQSYEQGTPIEWIRVHNNPDHVFFSHAQHVTIGKVECQECHGQVEEMHRVRQVSDLSMGWCIKCHRESQIDLHSNEFYDNYELIMNKVKNGEIDKVTVESLGGTECMKCHY